MTLRREQQLVSPVPLFLCWLVMAEMLDAKSYISLLVSVCNAWWWTFSLAGGLLRCSTARGQQSSAKAALLAQPTANEGKECIQPETALVARKTLLSLPACLPNLSIRPPHSTIQPIPAACAAYSVCTVSRIIRDASHDCPSAPRRLIPVIVITIILRLQ